MGSARKLFSNSAYLMMDFVMATLMGFVYWIIVGKLLKPESLGVISTSFNLASIITGVSALGLGLTVWKLLPEYLAKNQQRNVLTLIRFSLKIIIVTNFIAVAAFLSLNHFLSLAVNLPSVAIIATGIMVFALSMSTQTGMIMYGFQKMRDFLFTDWWGQVARISVSVILILLSFDYLGPIIGLIATFSITSILRFASIPLRGKTIKINRRQIMLHYALPALVSFIFISLFSSGQYVLLTALQNTKETGIYSITMTMVTPIAVIPSTLTGALFPITSELSANKDKQKQRSSLIGLVLRYTLFVTLPLAFFLMVFSKQIILFLFRAEYLPATTLFPVLSIASLIYGIGNVFLNNLYAIGETKINRNITILTTIIFFILAVPLIKSYYSLGLAFSYGASVTFLCLLSYFYIRKHIEINFPLKDMLKLIIATAIPLSIIYFLSIATSGYKGIIIDLFLLAVGAVIYLLLLIPIRFYREEDVRLLKRVEERFPRFKKPIGFMIRLISK